MFLNLKKILKLDAAILERATLTQYISSSFHHLSRSLHNLTKLWLIKKSGTTVPDLSFN